MDGSWISSTTVSSIETYGLAGLERVTLEKNFRPQNSRFAEMEFDDASLALLPVMDKCQMHFCKSGSKIFKLLLEIAR